MPLSDLSIDIWCNIIIRGRLKSYDIINLLKTSVSIYKLLNCELIWSSIGYSQLKTLSDYALWPEIQENTNSLALRSLIARRLSEKESGLMELLEKYKPRGEYNIATYLDKFTVDSDYIPIIISLIESYEDKMDACLDKNIPFEDFSKLSLLHNLLEAQNTRILLKSIESFYESWSDIKSTSYEFLWFRLSLFDKSFHRLVNQRERAFKIIREWLHREIFVEELINEKIQSVELLKKKEHEEKYTIMFKNEKSFVKFIVRCMRIAIRYFKPFNTSTIEREYVFEDFSIVRVYSNHANGHPLLLMSIMVKIIDEFLSTFNLRFPNKALDNFSLDITKNFIRMLNYFIKFQFDEQSNSYHVSAFTISNVTEYMRTTLNYSDNDIISKLLEPVNMKYMVTYFLDVDFLYKRSSNSRIAYHNSFISTGRADSRSNQLQTKVIMISPKEFEFIKYVCKTFILDYRNQFDTFSFENLFNTYNNFIYFRSVMELSGLRTSLKRLMKLDTDEISFSANFDLNDPKSKVSFNQVWKNFFYTSSGYQEGITPNILTGAVVYHRKFQTYGVVINSFGVEDYYYVFTNERLLEVYSAKSFIPLSKIEYDKSHILKLVIYSCGIDILGLMFFENIIFENNCGKFELIKE